MKKKIVNLSIYLLGLIILIGGPYFFLIKPQLLPCGSIDRYLDRSGCEQQLEFGDATTLKIIFTPDGSSLGTLSADRVVNLWDVNSGTLLYTITPRNTGTIINIALSADGTVLAIVFHRSIELWEIDEGTFLDELQGDATFAETALSPDLATAATGSPVGPIKLWHMDTHTQTLLHTLQGHADQIWHLSFTMDGTMLASGSYDETVRLWRVSDGKLLHTLKGQMGAIQSLAFTPSGNIIAAGGTKVIKFWRTDNGTLTDTLEGHKGNLFNPGYIKSLVFSPDGKLLASGGKDSTVRVWRVSDGTLLHTIEHGNEVWSVAFSPNGKILASAELGGPVRLFDVKPWNLDSNQSE